MTPQATNIEIRPMAPADLDQVVEIDRSLSQAPHWPLAAYIAALDPDSSPRRVALVAVDQRANIAVGFTVASLLPPQAELETIAITAEVQRRGVARRLFTALAEELRTAHGKEIILEVRESNHPALAFYRAQGFLETGRRPRYYADPQEDAVLLSLRLG